MTVDEISLVIAIVMVVVVPVVYVLLNYPDDHDEFLPSNKKDDMP